MHCHHDYKDAKSEFGEYMDDNYGVDSDEALETLQEIDRKNVERFGLSSERFPTSFVEACEEFVGEVSESERETVRSIGASVFKSVEEYQERGFRDGAERFLEEAQERTEELHLITAGDRDVQGRKIEGLGLEEWFDGVHIVEIDGKDERIQEIVQNKDHPTERVFHIGNSSTSDVEAALRAGVNAVYLPEGEWRKTDVDTTEFDNHLSVHRFREIGEFVAEMDAVLPLE